MNPGGINPDMPDVRYPWQWALPAANHLYTVAKSVHNALDKRYPIVIHGIQDWTGPHRETFDGLNIDSALHASGTETLLTSLANRVAQQWANARSDQDRLNWARWVKSETQRALEDDSALEDFGEFFAGEDEAVREVGSAPGNRAVPVAPDYTATTQNHPDFDTFSSFGP